MPVFEVGYPTNNENGTITTLIPNMNFTHPATIAGFIVAGRMFNQEPSSKIQIWRQNSSQPCAYYRVDPDIIINRNMVCLSPRVANSLLFCILNDKHRVTVQPGDFLGLELNNGSEILFTSGGPKNYIFEHKLLISPIELNNFSYTTAQWPQIAFNLTSGKDYQLN